MGFFDKIKEGLSKTKSNFDNQMNRVFSNFRKVDEELLEELEEILIMSDLGVNASLKIIEELRENVKLKNIQEAQEIKEELKRIIINMLDVTLDVNEEKTPKCILVIGVNGAGKTTSIGKLAAIYKKTGKKVLIVPADTFRAAAGEQLQVWAKRAAVDIIEIIEKEDPASTVYRSLEYAKREKYDIILIDTAGRLQNKKNLMDELAKISNSITKIMPEAQRENYLVLDASVGQNTIEQAKSFGNVSKITGYILTKLDGTSKGGVIIGIVNETKIPVKYIGVGEGIEDLQKFDAVEYTNAILD